MAKFRLTQGQAKLVFGSKPVQNPVQGRAPVRRDRAQRDAMPENTVEAQIVGFLRAKGWIVKRAQVGTYVPYWAAMRLKEGGALDHVNVVRIGEAGEADWIVSRPVRSMPGLVHMFHMELKGPGQHPKEAQNRWMARAKALGLMAVWFNSFDRFRSWYYQTWSPPSSRDPDIASD